MFNSKHANKMVSTLKSVLERTPGLVITDAVIHSDNGTEFKNKFMTIMITGLGSRQVFSAVYHPQTQGLVEKLNGTIKLSLLQKADGDGAWSVCYEQVLIDYNNTKHSTIGMSPNEAVNKCVRKLTLNVNGATLEDVLNEDAMVKKNIEMVKERTIKCANKANKAHLKGKDIASLKVGDRVVVRLPKRYRKKNESQFPRSGK
ncbi:Gag-Pol polyprotein, partial [Acrasis kona]